jgi:ribosome-binding protein aMBF1 (putative translation factor)
MESYLDKQLKNPEFAKVYAEEGLINDFTELLATEMQKQGLSKKAFAKKLGVSERNVTRVLQGYKVSLRKAARMAHALGFKIEMQFVK